MELSEAERALLQAQATGHFLKNENEGGKMQISPEYLKQGQKAAEQSQKEAAASVGKKK